MRKFAIIFALCCLSLPAWSQLPLAKAQCGHDVSCTPAAVNLTGATLIVVGVGSYDNTPTVSFSPAQTYLATSLYSGISHMKLKMFYVYNPNINTSQSVTCSMQYGSCFIRVYNGTVTLSSVLDGQSGGHGGPGACLSVQPGAITPTGAGNLIVDMVTDLTNSGTTYAIDSGFSTPDTNPFVNGQSEPAAISDLSDSSTSPVNPTWTLVGSQSDCTSMQAGFKLVAPSSPSDYKALVNMIR